MRVSYTNRISFVLARNIIFIALLLGLITTGNQIWGDLVQARRECSLAIQQILEMQQKAAAQAIWQLDEKLADRILEGLLYYEPITEATIEGQITKDSQAVLAHKKREVKGTDARNWWADLVINTTVYSTQLSIAESSKPIGSLSVRISSERISEPFFHRTLRNILSAVIPLTVLALVLVLMFYYSLTKPLFDLSSRLGEVDTEQPMRSQLQIPSGHQNDELALVVSTTNRLLFQFEHLLARHKKTEQELIVAEKKYRSIFDNAMEGIYQSTFDGRFISANRALAKFLGYESPGQLIAEISETGIQLFCDTGKHDATVSRLLQDGVVVNLETQFRRKDGVLVWGSQSARIVRDETGQPLFIEGMIADITGPKQAREDLAKVEAQLIQSQKMEALGNLTGGIAHDFNNILHVISGLAQLLIVKKNELDPEYKYLNEINKAATRAGDLVRGLLIFSRKVEKNVIPLNLNDVVNDTLELLQRTVPKMITLQTFLAPDLAIIPADPAQMEQVIMNLANNAVQAMEESGILTIETENFPLRSRYANTYLELEPGDYILLKVTDTGHGMDEATRKRIFEPFFTTKARGKGTGLGLASAYGIVTGHSGKITCYSELGSGTTFKIFLPVSTGITSFNNERSGQPPAELRGGTETLLLVDDEKTILTIAEGILHQYGYKTHSVQSGEEALEAYLKHGAGIDLIIMDLGMPGMGGKKCLEEVLKINPVARVIVASGYGSYDIIENPKQFGVAAFLSKPYRPDMLIRTVREILDRPLQ